MSKLAILGGTPAVDKTKIPDGLFHWPVLSDKERADVAAVLENNRMSGNEITTQFESEFASWLGVRRAVCATNGTMAIQAAMFAAGLGAGDEMICPTKTYWATCLSAQTLGVSVVFANSDPDTVCLDPKDLERCLSEWTKAIMVVHYWAHPCDMDAIMSFAREHDLIVIEDVSHAQGGRYKGKRLGTFGKVSAMSLMSQKSFSAGELGVLVTDDETAYQRALAYLHYERNNADNIDLPELTPYLNLPLGGMKGRANQFCTAMAREQLRTYDERCVGIRRALDHFWDEVGDVPGVHGIRVDPSDGSDMAGWYTPHYTYHPEELGGLSLSTFDKALSAETGIPFNLGGNFPLHTHPIFQTYDALGLGRPSRIAFAHRDVRELDKDLEPTERILCGEVPYFKSFMPEYIDIYAGAVKKVVDGADEIIAALGKGEDVGQGQWYGKV